MFIYGESSNDIHHPRTEKRPEHRDGPHKSRRCCRQSACAAAVRVERSRHGLSGSSVWSSGLRSSLIVCPRVSVALPSPTDQRPPSAVFLFGIPSRRLQERRWCVFARKAVKYTAHRGKRNPEGRQVARIGLRGTNAGRCITRLTMSRRTNQHSGLPLLFF